MQHRAIQCILRRHVACLSCTLAALSAAIAAWLTAASDASRLFLLLLRLVLLGLALLLGWVVAAAARLPPLLLLPFAVAAAGLPEVAAEEASIVTLCRTSQTAAASSEGKQGASIHKPTAVGRLLLKQVW